VSAIYFCLVFDPHRGYAELVEGELSLAAREMKVGDNPNPNCATGFSACASAGW